MKSHVHSFEICNVFFQMSFSKLPVLKYCLFIEKLEIGLKTPGEVSEMLAKHANNNMFIILSGPIGLKVLNTVFSL